MGDFQEVFITVTGRSEGVKATAGSPFWKVLTCDHSHDDKAIKWQRTYIFHVCEASGIII